jgi:HrpA-like RNA helicase
VLQSTQTSSPTILEELSNRKINTIVLTLFSDIPQAFIKSGCYPVSENYLEDMIEMCPPVDTNCNKIIARQRAPMIADARRNYVIDFIMWKHKTADKANSFLVFLPGISEIDWMFESIETRDRGVSIQLHILHSIISTEEQELIFEPSPKGVRKILLATNIAESSVTIPDCQVVIDFCLAKTMMWDSISQCRSLNMMWTSKDSAQQRKGRSGRVMPGELYRIVTRSEFDSFPTSVQPQIQNEPLDRLVLRILQNPNWDDPATVLSKLYIYM